MKKMYKILFIPFVFLLFAFVSSCSNDDKVKVEQIRFDNNELTLMVHEIKFIKTIILPTDASARELDWVSSNPEIATVKNGEIIGIAEGETIITASADDQKSTCKVTVTKRRVKVEDILFENKELFITEEDNLALTVSILPEDATNKNITWTSDREAIVIVNEEGLITGIAEGEAYITATTEDGGIKASCKVTVERKGKVTNVELNKKDLTIIVGKNETLVAKVFPEDAVNKNVTWTSSNTAVATVDNTGKVTAIATGNAIITVTTEDGSKTATCQISVISVFEDNFNRADTGIIGKDNPQGIGEKWTVSSGSFEIKNNVLNGKAPAPDGSSLLIYNENGALTRDNGNFSLSFDCTITADGSWGGLAFNIQNSESYYVFRTRYDGEAQFLATTDNGKNWNILQRVVIKRPSSIASNTTYRYTLTPVEPKKYHILITDTSGATVGEFNLIDNKSVNYIEGQFGMWTQTDKIFVDNFYFEIK